MPRNLAVKGFTVDRDLGEKFIREQLTLVKANKPFVKVGLQASESNRRIIVDTDQFGPGVVVKGKNTSGVKHTASLVQIGTYNEFGTSRIPERSFIRSTMDEKRGELITMNRKLLGRIFQKNLTFKTALELLDQKITALIKNKITTLSSPPNAPSTIRKKGSSNPLIDTGRMRSSITHIVVEDGE